MQILIEHPVKFDRYGEIVETEPIIAYLEDDDELKIEPVKKYKTEHDGESFEFHHHSVIVREKSIYNGTHKQCADFIYGLAGILGLANPVSTVKE